MAGRVVVMTSGPGRLAGEIVVDAPVPRPAGFRTTPAFRDMAEHASTLLRQGMGAAA
jgi:NitT/TauT family transport system ATP-binding protein